jgi:exonuclease VII large subunit
MNDDEKRFLEQIQKQNEDAHAETRRQFAELAQRFDTKTEEIERRFESTTERIEQRFDSTTARIEQRFDTKTAEIEQRFDETARLMRRHFDTVAEDIKKETHREIQLLAESVAHVDHKVDVNSAKIDRLAADNEVFKASFAHLDRRLRVVEDIVLPQKPS